MKMNILILFRKFTNITKSIQNKKLNAFLVLITGVTMLTPQLAKSEEIFLKCIGKYEINRGPLIKPDWETSYLKINLNGLISTVDNKGGTKKGRTKIRRNSYTITYRDNRNSIKDIYKINGTHGTYTVEYPQSNRILIGTCQKGRG
tara:strand:- start:238 stop:675 length:438 start_codon:yes stop_codon:yes gene_type:complete